MLNGKITHLLIIFLEVIIVNNAGSQGGLIPPTLVNLTDLPDSITEPTGLVGTECKNKSAILKSPLHKPNGQNQVRFIDLSTNDSLKDDEMEAPAAKFSFMNLLTDVEDEDNGDQDIEPGDYSNENKVKQEQEEEEEEEDEDEDDDIGFFEDEEETGPDKLKDENDEGLLKQYHRPGLRMHSLVFPLLLAYKLKFFTVIPLLLGSLVLLVGTTGIAGFFFALFAAALGIHVKSHGH